MFHRAIAWLRDQGHGTVIRSASSLVGVTLTTAGLGAVYWALAARVFPPAALGAAAAALSILMLVGQLSTVGLGTLLMGELSHHPGVQRPMIYTGLVIAGLVGASIGVVAIALASKFVPDLAVLREPVTAAIFAIGTGATAAGLVLDQALLGLLHGGLQLLRNAVASLAKLGALGLVWMGLLAGPEPSSLVGTWVFGTVASLGLLIVVHRIARADPGAPHFQLPSGLAALAARHHLFNLSILAPGLVMPLVVTAITSAEGNAYFYIASLVASFASAGPAALATALYASGSRDTAALASRVRFAFWLSMAAGVALNVFMIFGAQPLLTIFGESYADRSTLLLRLFSLGIFAVTINSLFVPIARIERRFLQGTGLMLLSMAIHLTCVVTGGLLGGLEGIGYGWLIGYTLGTLPLVPAVWRIAVRGTVRRAERDALGPLPPIDVQSGDRPADEPPASTEARPAADAEARAAGRERDARPEAEGVARTLTTALLTDGPRLSRWQAACAATLLGDERVELVSWLHAGASPRMPREPRALAPAAAAEIPSGMPAPVAARGLGDGHDSDGPFDLLVDLTTDGAGALEAVAARRRWAFTFGADGRRDPLRVGLRDIVLGRGTIPVSLVDCADGRKIQVGFLRTTAWTINGQFERLLLDTSAWLADAAAELLDGRRALDAWAEPSRTLAGPCAEARAPSGIDLPLPALWIAARARQIAAIAAPLARHDDWNVGLVDRPIGKLLEGTDLGHVRWLPRRPGRYAADPFGVERNGQLHVLFEDYDLRRGKAIISATTFGSDGTFSEPEPAVDPGCHASYPFLLEADGEVWMIPETTRADEVRLYRAVELPHRWTLECRILTDVQVSDPTIVWSGDRWWMFGTSRPHGVDHALRIWHARALTGPWTIHEKDPVKFDARSARPGGTPFTADGVLYRPAQDCSRRYGGRVVINRVEHLATDAYREVPAAVVEPRAAYPHGLHTLSAVGGRTLIDGNAARFAPEALPVQLRRGAAAG